MNCWKNRTSGLITDRAKGEHTWERLFSNMTMSLDGFVAGPNDGPEKRSGGRRRAAL